STLGRPKAGQGQSPKPRGGGIDRTQQGSWNVMNLMKGVSLAGAFAAGLFAASGAAMAQPLFRFSTGAPDGRMAAAARAETVSTNVPEIETGDDFVVTNEVFLKAATFTGLIPAGAPLGSVSAVEIEIYRVFPLDSDLTRQPAVPSRNNSPSDNA